MLVLLGFLCVVLHEKKAKDDEVHEDGFGEGESFTGESSQALAQREVEPLDVVGLSFFFAARLMLLLRQHFLIRFPQVAKAKSALVVSGNLVPQSAARSGTAVTPMPSHDLPCPSAQRHPQPHRLLFALDKAPEFVQLQDIIALGCQQRWLQVARVLLSHQRVFF